MRNLDFSSWQAILSTLVGLAVITIIGVGIRIVAMQTVQLRRERDNRRINERLRTLIAAYKVLGGSFTGDLAVDPSHLRQSRESTFGSEQSHSDRSRRIRDAVEASLSDIILLGTESQVELAAKAATDLAAGRSVHTAELVISLRDFIREVLDLEPVPPRLAIPRQGPARPVVGRSAKNDSDDKEAKNSDKSGDKDGGGGGAAGQGPGMTLAGDEDTEHHR